MDWEGSRNKKITSNSILLLNVKHIFSPLSPKMVSVGAVCINLVLNTTFTIWMHLISFFYDYNMLTQFITLSDSTSSNENGTY